MDRLNLPLLKCEIAYLRYFTLLALRAWITLPQPRLEPASIKLA